MRAHFIAYFIIVVVGFSACSGGAAGPQSEVGMDVAITTQDTSGILGAVSMAAQSYTGIPVSDVSFRGSELTFYSIDSSSVDIILNSPSSYQTAFDSISSTQVLMPLPDIFKTVTFSRSGNSSLPIEQVGNFRNLDYNLININVGGGEFYYETTDDTYALVADTGEGVLRFLGTDIVRVSNILLIDRSLWESLAGAGTGIQIFENDDAFRFDTYPSNLADGVNDIANGAIVPADTPIGTGEFWTSDNPLMAFLTAEPQFSDYFDIDGCIVYPIEGSINLTSFTQLEHGYENIDPDEANIDIRIRMNWAVPATVTMEELEDPANIDPGDLQALYLNRKIRREVAGEGIYNFSVSVEVEER